ncbi:MAG TPA: aminotransferase class V-fold PLP-dependent enzyme [Polyangiaceae bacterium]|jgi:aromatic-L-amino-acid decarboxylase|nr:aminotransferase class V-fold PLP-dependent enzyme [Polyangiaceae bacterium]
MDELDIDPSAMRAMAHAVVERLIDHLATLDTQPARGDLTNSEALSAALREPPPETGSELEALLAPLFDDWVHRSFNAPGPGYLAYIPGGGIFPAGLGELIAAGLNRYTGVWNAAPAFLQLEANVLDWFRTWLEYPPSARGLLTSGGSLATFSAIVTAREALLGTRLREGVLYASTEAHHSVTKVARLAGILDDRVRVLATDAAMRLDVQALDQAIAADRKAGLVPFMVVSSGGTTNTGAVDPLEEIADVCARESLWHHCDAAYGGFFYMCPELRPLLAGLPRADSITLDPHKGLFLPYGTGALLVKDGEALRRAHRGTAGYLPTFPDTQLYNPCEYGPELSRPFRGLPVWLPLKLFGAERFRAALREKRELALRAYAALEHVAGIHRLEPPALSLFPFYLSWPGASLAEENEATQTLMERVCARDRVMITGAPVKERYLGRICVLCFRTHQDRIDACIEDIALESAALTTPKR